MKSEIFEVHKSSATELFCRRDSEDWKHHFAESRGLRDLSNGRT
jgi:hypothetical protein